MQGGLPKRNPDVLIHLKDVKPQKVGKHFLSSVSKVKVGPEIGYMVEDYENHQDPREKREQ